jgi:hypothetical protein
VAIASWKTDMTVTSERSIFQTQHSLSLLQVKGLEKEKAVFYVTEGWLLDGANLVFLLGGFHCLVFTQD